MAHTYVEIFSELFYRAKREGLDPAMWRVSRRARRELQQEFNLMAYWQPGPDGTSTVFGLPMVLEIARPRLPPARVPAGPAEPPQDAVGPRVVCLECIEPYRGRTVYREWIDGQFV